MSIRFELLFARAAPHSIDLKQLAAQSIDYYGAGAPRRRNLMEQLAGLPVRETASGSQTRSRRIGTLSSIDEIGIALGGLRGPEYLAAMYSMALDSRQRAKLWSELRWAAADMWRDDEWPERIPRASGGGSQHYGDELCALVLDEDWLKPIFQAAPQLYWIALDVPEEVWRMNLLYKFLQVRVRYERWLSKARGHVNRRIFEELHRDDVATCSEAV